MVISNMPKVVVGMSGGVDSSVAAALLVEQGYQVIGVMLRLWSEPGREGRNRCCTPDSMAQARRVASLIGFPFYSIDAKELFRQKVVDMFINGYLRGLTPNPCLACNQIIRWGFLLDQARLMGADYLATGHYARLSILDNGAVQLLEGIDQNKDQSYVLSVLNQEQLSHTILPLGNYKKPEVRLLAHKYNLPVAERAESQDLCFLGGINYRLFMHAHVPEAMKPGLIVNHQGDILGKHEGLAYYTIGQRKGIRISAANPLYVIEKKLDENKLIVGPASELGFQRLKANRVNWIGDKPADSLIRAQVKTRYKAKKVWSTIKQQPDSGLLFEFDEPQRDLTPGQNAVIYQDDVCLGSGLIQEVFK
jgi:tRNA-uridine 2-sulfurtransferase